MRGFDRELTGARLGLGDIGEDSERQDFALDWVLSEAGGNSMGILIILT